MSTNSPKAALETKPQPTATTERRETILFIWVDQVKIQLPGSDSIFRGSTENEFDCFLSLFPLNPWVEVDPSYARAVSAYIFRVSKTQEGNRSTHKETAHSAFMFFRGANHVTQPSDRRLLVYLERECTERKSGKRIPCLERIGFALTDFPDAVDDKGVLVDLPISTIVTPFRNNSEWIPNNQSQTGHQPGVRIATVRLFVKVESGERFDMFRMKEQPVFCDLVNRIQTVEDYKTSAIVGERQLISSFSVQMVNQFKKEITRTFGTLVALYEQGRPESIAVNEMPIMFESAFGILPQIFFYEHAWTVFIPDERWCVHFTNQMLRLALLTSGRSYEWFKMVAAQASAISFDRKLSSQAQSKLEVFAACVLRVAPMLINLKADSIGESYAEPDLSLNGIPNAQIDCKKLAYFTILVLRIIRKSARFVRNSIPALDNTDCRTLANALSPFSLYQLECTMSVRTRGDQRDMSLHVVNLLIPWSYFRRDAGMKSHIMLVDGTSNHQISQMSVNAKYEASMVTWSALETGSMSPFCSWAEGRRRHSYGEALVMYNSDPDNNAVAPMFAATDSKRNSPTKERSVSRTPSLFDILEQSPSVRLIPVLKEQIAEFRQSRHWKKMQISTNGFSNLSSLLLPPAIEQESITGFSREIESLIGSIANHLDRPIADFYHVALFTSTVRKCDRVLTDLCFRNQNERKPAVISTRN